MEDSALKQHFKQAAPFWKSVYEEEHVYAVVHQTRRETVLSIVDELQLEHRAEVLDIGCGAGTISVPLASRNFKVTGVDAVPEMIALTKQLAADSGIGSNLEARVGDIHHLDFPDQSFELVLAIGVLPWLTEYEAAVREMRRVLKPGAYLVVNVDNRWGLHRILDPVTNFLLARLRVGTGRLLRFLRIRKRERGVRTTLMSTRQFNRLLAAAGFKIMRGKTLGFGPFTGFQQQILPNSAGVKFHHLLQDLCDRKVPVLRSMGGQYLVLAQKQDLP